MDIMRLSANPKKKGGELPRLFTIYILGYAIR